jgi:hypothetical protein
MTQVNNRALFESLLTGQGAQVPETVRRSLLEIFRRKKYGLKDLGTKRLNASPAS